MEGNKHVCFHITHWSSLSNELYRNIIEEVSGEGYELVLLATTLTFLECEYMGWWLGIHFLPPVDSFYVRDEII